MPSEYNLDAVSFPYAVYTCEQITREKDAQFTINRYKDIRFLLSITRPSPFHKQDVEGFLFLPRYIVCKIPFVVPKYTERYR